MHKSVHWGGFCSVVGLLHVCVLAKARDLEIFLQHVGICGFYPLVVILLRLDDLEAKLSVEVNGGLVANLDMSGIGREGEGETC